MDFTVEKYNDLLKVIESAGYCSMTRFDYSKLSEERRQVVLRHDVDLRPDYSLRIARLEAEMGYRAIYYFRCVPESLDPLIVREIASIGHEIGYHYESLTTCNGNIEIAYQDFCTNLETLSKIVGSPIKTICMHGSPRSSYDSRDLWKHYDYHDLGIDFEPYFDTDFSKTFYLTDTGRRWDGYKVSVRDKIPQYQDEWLSKGLSYHTTDDIIAAIEDSDSLLNSCYQSIMITTHPQRWMPFGANWMKEYCLQNAKNLVKRVIVSSKTNV